MKLHLSLVFASFVLIAGLHGQENSTTPAKPAPSIDTGTSQTSNPDDSNTNPLANLSKDDRVNFQKIVKDVLDAYGREDYDNALTRLDAADALTPKNPDLINLRGAIFIKQKKWDQAIAQFNNVLAINPKYFPARFNLGEVPFQQKKFVEARAIFQKILADEPKSELLLYKIFLTYLFEPNPEQAQAYLSKFDEYGNSPAFYFATAAWYFSKQQEKEANSYIGSSLRIYSPAANALFAEPLMDAGYLKRPVIPKTPTAQ